MGCGLRSPCSILRHGVRYTPLNPVLSLPVPSAGIHNISGRSDPKIRVNQKHKRRCGDSLIPIARLHGRQSKMGLALVYGEGLYMKD